MGDSEQGGSVWISQKLKRNGMMERRSFFLFLGRQTEKSMIWEPRKASGGWAWFGGGGKGAVILFLNN